MRRRVCREIRRQRDDHLMYGRMRHERGDTALEDRTSVDAHQLLGLGCTEPQAAAAGRNDRRDVHLEKYTVTPRSPVDSSSLLPRLGEGDIAARPDECGQRVDL